MKGTLSLRLGILLALSFACCVTAAPHGEDQTTSAELGHGTDIALAVEKLNPPEDARTISNDEVAKIIPTVPKEISEVVKNEAPKKHHGGFGKPSEVHLKLLRDPELPGLSPEEIQTVQKVFAELGKIIFRRLKLQIGSWNLETELANVLRKLPGSTSRGTTKIPHDDHDDFLDYADMASEDVVADEVEMGVRHKRSLFGADYGNEFEESNVIDDNKFLAGHSTKSDSNQELITAEGVELGPDASIDIEPGQVYTISENGQVRASSTSNSAKTDSVESSSHEESKPRTPKRPKKARTALTDKLDGKQEITVNAKVSGLLALLQKTVSDGHFRHPMDKDMPIDHIQVKLRNGTRYFYEMTRDVASVDHSSDDCDPETDKDCPSPAMKGPNLGAIHVHLSNGTTLNYSFKKTNQLNPISMDDKERTLKIKMFVTAARAMDELLFKNPGDPNILKDKVHFEELYLAELGRRLRDSAMLIPAHDEASPIGGIAGNEVDFSGVPMMSTGSGADLDHAVENYMGILSSEITKAKGLVGTPMPMTERVDMGAAAAYLVGGTAGAVVFLAVMFVSAHWLESCNHAPVC